MIGTGKYNFPGIRKASALAINVILANTAWGASLLASPFRPVLDFIETWILEWLTNKGLIIIDIGAIVLSGPMDQADFDKAFDDALEKVKIPGLSEAQKAAIDAKVITAFRNFGRITRNP